MVFTLFYGLGRKFSWIAVEIGYSAESRSGKFFSERNGFGPQFVRKLLNRRLHLWKRYSFGNYKTSEAVDVHNYSTIGVISQGSQVACAEDEDGDYELDIPEGISISKEGLPQGLVSPEGPFSALIPSMIPQELLYKINNSKDTEDPNEQPEFRCLLSFKSVGISNC